MIPKIKADCVNYSDKMNAMTSICVQRCTYTYLIFTLHCCVRDRNLKTPKKIIQNYSGLNFIFFKSVKATIELKVSFNSSATTTLAHIKTHILIYPNL